MSDVSGRSPPKGDMLKYARKKCREFNYSPTRATDVLYRKMHVYNREAKEILSVLIKGIHTQNPNSPVLKSLYQEMRKTDEIAIDCANKLAPYQSPKLESIEVKNQVEHRFVIRAPNAIKSVEEWAKMTGAETLRLSNKVKGTKIFAEPVESLHDFDDGDSTIH